jgi:hypothetical protein
MGLPALAFALAAGSTAVSIHQSRKAAKAQERAQKIEQKKQDYTTARERRKQIRAARVAQAGAATQARVSGTTSSSRTGGVAGGIQSEMASNVGFLNTQQGFTHAIGRQNIKAAQAQSRASTASAIAGLSMQSASLFGSASPQTPEGGGGVVDPKTGAIMSPNPPKPSFFS